MEAENSALCFARVVFIRPSRKQNKTKKNILYISTYLFWSAGLTGGVKGTDLQWTHLLTATSCSWISGVLGGVGTRRCCSRCFL